MGFLVILCTLDISFKLGTLAAFKGNNSSYIFSFCGWAIFLDAFFGDLNVNSQISCKKLLEPYFQVQLVIDQNIDVDKLKQKPQHSLS